MSNLIFSLNIVFPIFVLIIIGYFLKHRGLLTPEFRSKATTLVFNYALPCSLFRSVAASDMKSGFSPSYVGFLLTSSIGIFFLSWLLTVLFIKDRTQISATVHGAYRGNFAYVGLAILQNLLDTANLKCAVLVIAFVVPLYNILAIFILSRYGNSGRKLGLKEQVLAIIRNPLIIAILLGIPFSVLGISFPVMIDKSLSYMAQLATPLALLLIGATLEPSTFRKKPGGIILGTVVKIVIAPIICTLIALAIGYRNEELATVFVLHAVPSAVNCYIMTEKMGGDAELGAGIVMASSLLSVITMTVGIFLLKTCNLL
ncbi:MAG: AEC family transporter [Clostridia bacterium]|nr:AEC family transporter [Clostridia bacterium]